MNGPTVVATSCGASDNGTVDQRGVDSSSASQARRSSSPAEPVGVRPQAAFVVGRRRVLFARGETRPGGTPTLVPQRGEASSWGSPETGERQCQSKPRTTLGLSYGLRRFPVIIRWKIGLLGGDGGIRTLDTPLKAYNGLANRRLQPLGHVSSPAKPPNRCENEGLQVAVKSRPGTGS